MILVITAASAAHVLGFLAGLLVFRKAQQWCPACGSSLACPDRCGREPGSVRQRTRPGCSPGRVGPGAPVTGRAPLPRRVPGTHLDRVAGGVLRRRVVGRAPVPGAIAWVADRATLQRLADGLRGNTPPAGAAPTATAEEWP